MPEAFFHPEFVSQFLGGLKICAYNVTIDPVGYIGPVFIFLCTRHVCLCVQIGIDCDSTLCGSGKAGIDVVHRQNVMMQKQ